MTYYDAWITAPNLVPGLLESEEKTPPASTLTTIGPLFPEGRDVFFALHDGILSGRFRGRQIDPLTWAAFMTKEEILAFMADVYGPPGQYEKHAMLHFAHLAEEMRALRAFVAALPEDETFAVVFDEF